MNTNPDSDLDLATEERVLPKPSLVAELLLAIAGLLLTVFSTFVEISATNPPWQWWQGGIYPNSLGTTYQVGAVLLTACVAGGRAGAIAQMGYIFLGLAWLPVFAQGGGWAYWQQPTFGYLLGFIPGAWVCGWLAYRSRRSIETLALASLAGLGIIHGSGIIYLLILAALPWANGAGITWSDVPQALLNFSWVALPGQLVLVCLTAVLAYFLRRILFY